MLTRSPDFFFGTHVAITHLLRRCLAELLGTFVLVFAGCGAIVVQTETGSLGHVGVALTWGLVVLALVYAFGDRSGAHLNPAVTVALAVAHRFPRREVLPYCTAQLLGALFASTALAVLFPNDVLLGGTLPRGSAWRAFAIEAGLTWFLVLAVLTITRGAANKTITVGIVAGCIIGLEAMFAGPITGASMNPARSLAPALIGGSMGALWIYLTAPLLGSLLAVPTCRAISAPGCCSASEGASS